MKVCAAPAASLDSDPYAYLNNSSASGQAHGWPQAAFAGMQQQQSSSQPIMASQPHLMPAQRGQNASAGISGALSGPAMQRSPAEAPASARLPAQGQVSEHSLAASLRTLTASVYANA